ncbi:hypothetical protein [Bosea sp. (in: a-proteobacteria)]
MAAAAPADMTASRFMAALRKTMQQQGLTLPQKDDCYTPRNPCRMQGLPETLQLWAYPNAEGIAAEIRVLSDGTEGSPADVAEAAQKLCLGSLRVLTRSKINANALDKGYESARLVGEWRGTVGGISVRIRADAKYPIGSCQLTLQAAAAPG